MSLILGIESSCDETAAALVDVGPAHPRAQARRPGGRAPALWRRRPGDRRARPCRDPARPDRAGAGRGAGRAGRGRRDRRDRRARADRRGDGRAGHRQGAGAGGGQAADRGQPSRGPCAVADAERSRPSLPLSAAARLGRPLPAAAASRASAATAGSPPRSTTRPARRSTRPPSCSASAFPAGRRSSEAAKAGDPAAVPLPRPLVGSRRAAFLLRRPQERGAARQGERPSRRADIAASFQQAVVDCLVDRTRRAHRGGARARPRWSSPAASRPTTASARRSPRSPRRTICPSSRRLRGCAPTMRR